MRRAGVLTAIAVAVLAAAPAARADETIYAGPPGVYFNPEVETTAGEAVTFQNLDTISHDVLSTGKGADGRPLFRSELVSGGASSPVSGAEKLGAGSYGFVCSLHPSMTGTLTVTGSGSAPAPPSGSGSGDTTAPKVSVHVLDTRLSTVRKRRVLRLHVTTDEAAKVGVRARSGRTTLGARSLSLSKGTTLVRLKLTRKGLSLVRRSRKLRVAVTANAADSSGNASTARASRTLR